jgi:hypothetical protein
MSSTKQNVEVAETRADALRERIFSFLEEQSGFFVVSAAPGSGKSVLLLKLVKQLVTAGKRVVVATQTNSQADNLAKDWFGDVINGGSQFTRFSSSKHTRPATLAPENWSTKFGDIPSGPRVIVANAKKWAYSCATDEVENLGIHTLFVDEAYQMTWSTFMQLSPLAPRVVMIGDAGQIPPVVRVESRAWDTSLMPPHWSAPQTLERLKANLGKRYQFEELPTSWRIPEESLKFVQPFYENVSLDPVAASGERGLTWHSSSMPNGEVGEVLLSGAHGHPVLVKVPIGDEGAPQYNDNKVAKAVANILQALFNFNTETEMVSFSGEKDFRREVAPLLFKDVMIISTKRSMLAVLEDAVQPTVHKYRELSESLVYSKGELNGGLLIDTPERTQGLQRKVVIVVHPLSGVANPTDFDLDTGRLSVMASRHQVALFVVSRESVGEVLRENLPSATQALGVDDETGNGHRQHSKFWSSFDEGHTIDLSVDFVA